MSETVTKVVQGVDSLFDEIVVNGRTVKSTPSGRATHTTQTSPAPRAEPVEGEYVGAVQLNDVIHGLKDVPLTQRVANLESGVGNIESLIPSTASSSNKLTDKSYVDTADSGLQTDITNIGAEVTALQTLLGTIQQRLTELNAMIPNQASAQNQLADKDFVNSSISTNTANFLGTYSTLAEIEAIQNPTNNDYAFLETTDASGNTVFDRYKYSGADNQWLFEYELNNSSFTAEQWATINSGLTQSSVEGDIEDAIAEEVTNRNSAIANAITSLLAKIATQFSSSAVYTKDTYVSYEGSIYRCVNNHTGAWSAGDFTEVNLANDLMQIIKSISGGSKMNINEIAELFNINKNTENVASVSGGNAVDLYQEYGIQLICIGNYSLSGYVGEDLLYGENSGSSRWLIDMRNGIIYLFNESGYIVFGKNWFVNGSLLRCLKGDTYISYSADIYIKSPVYDGARAFAYIDNSGRLYYALLLNRTSSVSFQQALSGITCNNIINAKGKFVITTNSGTYISDSSWSTPTRVHTSSSSYACFGKNKFAMLVGGIVYFSEDAINWNATSMAGVSELYFSCGKFVARNSSGSIYYSDDLSEWKQSPITTTSGIFTDTVFMWNSAYYTRDFVNTMTLKPYSDNYGYPQSALIGGFSWSSNSNGVYYQRNQLANTSAQGSYITSYGAVIAESNHNYIKYVALKLVSANGDWLRRPLN